MTEAKRASKGKRPGKAISIMGLAGASWAASAAGSVADLPEGNIPTPQYPASFHLFLGDEEISDVSLATFHLFGKEELENLRGGIQLARGCGCGHGCGGHGGCGRVGVGGCGRVGVGGCR